MADFSVKSQIVNVFRLFRLLVSIVSASVVGKLP